jgi:VanZ family protein
MSDVSGGLERPAKKYRWLIWLAYVAAWSGALLAPIPQHLGVRIHDVDLRFVLAKTLHVSAYAVLAVLSGWLRVPSRFRWMLALFLAGHATATEFLQQYLPPRIGAVNDIGLDLIGIALGCALSWKWWCEPE